MRVRKVICLWGTCLALAGCFPEENLEKFSYAIARQKQDATYIISSGWTDAQYPKTPAPLYCYDTIGQNVCYAQPVDAFRNRLSGHYGPHPNDYWRKLKNGEIQPPEEDLRVQPPTHLRN